MRDLNQSQHSTVSLQTTDLTTATWEPNLGPRSHQNAGNFSLLFEDETKDGCCFIIPYFHTQKMYIVGEISGQIRSIYDI